MVSWILFCDLPQVAPVGQCLQQQGSEPSLTAIVRVYAYDGEAGDAKQESGDARGAQEEAAAWQQQADYARGAAASVGAEVFELCVAERKNSRVREASTKGKGKGDLNPQK